MIHILSFIFWTMLRVLILLPLVTIQFVLCNVGYFFYECSERFDAFTANKLE